MGALKVCLLCEGSGEGSGAIAHHPRPLDQLSEEHLGPAHVLARRLLANARSIPQDAVLFLEPLNVRGRVPKGSDLLRPRWLVTYPQRATAPDLSIVMIDGDGNRDRLKKVEADLKGLPAVAVAVAVEEFESWLISDHAAVVEVFGADIEKPARPESLPPRGARELLAKWFALHGRGRSERELRHRLAASIVIAPFHSRSLKQFAKRLM